MLPEVNLLYVHTNQEGKCIQLDSNQQQYVLLPPMDFTGLSRGFSFSFWFRHDAGVSENAHQARVFDFGNGANVNNILFGKNQHSNDAVMCIYGSNSMCTTISQGFVQYTWYHYVWVVQRTSATSTSSTWRVYQNGKLVSETANAPYPSAATRLNYIGRNHWNEAWFKGKVDSFGIFPSPIQSDQAALLMLKGSPVSYFIAYNN
jgi:hypothetical protein